MKNQYPIVETKTFPSASAATTSDVRVYFLSSAATTTRSSVDWQHIVPWEKTQILVVVPSPEVKYRDY